MTRIWNLIKLWVQYLKNFIQQKDKAVLLKIDRSTYHFLFKDVVSVSFHKIGNDWWKYDVMNEWKKIEGAREEDLVSMLEEEFIVEVR